MKPVVFEKSKRLIENRFYRDENLTSENIVKAFNLAGWQETRDWIGRDDDLTFIKGPSRISFSIVTNSGYNFTYYKDFEPKEYSADYIIYSGRNLKELEMDIEDFNNLEAKDFLRYKVPEFPWTKTTQDTEMLESKKLKENNIKIQGETNNMELKEAVDLVQFAELSSLLRKAKDQKVKQTGDHYAEVDVKAYCGGPFELKISYSNSDEGEPAFFYVTFDYEDDEDRNPSIEIRLYNAIKDKFRKAGILKEMQTEGLHVESSEIQKLEDIVNGQGFLFENKNSDKLKEDKDFVIVKIFDPFEDGEAQSAVASYGGQLDSDVWEINKENVQDIKDALEDWENRIAFYSSYDYSSGKFGRKLKEARVKYPGRDPQIDPSFIKQQTSIFFEDEGFSKIDYKAYLKPRTFRIGDKKDSTFEIDIAISGDYVDDILINTFFDSRCGYGYVIQTQTLEGPTEWAGFDRSEFKEDLEEAWVNAKKFFEANKDKHSLETWLNREVGRSISQDEIHDIIEKAYQQDSEDYFTKLLSRKEFDAKLASLKED